MRRRTFSKQQLLAKFSGDQAFSRLIHRGEDVLASTSITGRPPISPIIWYPQDSSWL
jgi:hypothetical protein